ncbi:MAG TPA: helix-turn-helix domain-containing protein [Blastocatellia bacterium]|nr:helix-turn-helix domain-containing protein [Blastocatellia bacterium]
MAAKKPREIPWRQRLFVSPLLTAQILNKSQSEVYKLCASKELPSVKCGSRWLIPTAGVIDYGARLLGGGKTSE